MATLAPQRPSRLAVVECTMVTPTVGGDQFANDGNTVLKVTTTSNAIVVTVAGVPCSHGRSANTVYNLLAGKEYHLGPFDPGLFNDGNGNVNITYDISTGAKVAAVRMTP